MDRLVDNYFVVGLEIGKRLAELDIIQAVLSVRDMETVEDQGVPTPSAMVVFMGEAPSADSFNRAAQVVAQRWLVELVVSNHAQDASNELAEAGWLIQRVIQHLQGWRPPGAMGPLRRISAPAPAYTRGVSLYPLVFEAHVLTQANELD
jgi:hypothetical protein